MFIEWLVNAKEKSTGYLFLFVTWNMLIKNISKTKTIM